MDESADAQARRAHHEIIISTRRITEQDCQRVKFFLVMMADSDIIENVRLMMNLGPLSSGNTRQLISSWATRHMGIVITSFRQKYYATEATKLAILRGTLFERLRFAPVFDAHWSDAEFLELAQAEGVLAMLDENAPCASVEPPKPSANVPASPISSQSSDQNKRAAVSFEADDIDSRIAHMTGRFEALLTSCRNLDSKAALHVVRTIDQVLEWAATESMYGGLTTTFGGGNQVVAVPDAE